MLDRLAQLIALHLRGYLDQRFDALQLELRKMSGTEAQLETDLAAQTTAVQSLTAEVSNGLAVNAAAIQALKDQIAAGTPVTAADLTTLEGNTKAVQDATAALQAALNPPPPAP